jgi:hypothetical protein
MPSLSTQAANALGAALRATQAVLSGRSALVPREVRAAREAICATCEENIAGRCRKCGCGIKRQWIRKPQLASEQCPLNPPKWTTWSQ